MRWLKIRHNEGYDLINISHVYRIEVNTVESNQESSDRNKTVSDKTLYEVVLFDANSVMPTVFSWDTLEERNRILKRLTEVLNIINL